MILFFGLALVFLYLPYKHEQKVLVAYLDYVEQGATDSIKKDKAAFAVHILNRVNTNILSGEKQSVDLYFSPLENLFTSPLQQYGLSKDGDCGGVVLSLAQLLQQYGYKVRPLQMLVGKVYGGHIVLDVKINDKWVVFDGLYNKVYKNPDSGLASYEELHKNWNYYKNQVPAHYDTTYKYEGVRYTNWNRLPVIGNLAKKIVAAFSDKENAEKFSFRTLLLTPRSFLFKTCFVILLILLAILGIKKIRQRNTRVTQPTI